MIFYTVDLEWLGYYTMTMTMITKIIVSSGFNIFNTFLNHYLAICKDSSIVSFDNTANEDWKTMLKTGDFHIFK